MTKKFSYRFLLYGVVVLYIILDLNVFKGPMHSWLMTKRGKSAEELRAEGVAATVYSQCILESQVEFRMSEYLYARGRNMDSVSPAEYPILFKHCLEQLITEHLLRIKTYYHESDLEISAEEVEKAYTQDSLQFSDAYERKDALRRQGYDENELKLRAEAHLQQRTYLNFKITQDPTEDELKELSAATVTLPERARIRHIFLSTWEKDPEEIREILATEVARLEAGEVTFAALSDELNEDARAKKTGGELDWVSRDRLPETMDEIIFSLPVGGKTLAKSPLGWHYIEVLDKKPAVEIARSSEEVRDHLENMKRRDGLKYYLQRLRARDADKVVILWKEDKD